MKNNFLLLTVLSVSLLAVNTSAQTNMICKDGKCFIDLKNIKPSKVYKKLFVPMSKQVLPKVINDEIIDLVTASETLVLSPSKYIMTKSEREKYEIEQLEPLEEVAPLEEIAPMEEMDQLELVAPMLPTLLPVSESFCDNDTKPVFHVGTDTFECV